MAGDPLRGAARLRHRRGDRRGHRCRPRAAAQLLRGAPVRGVLQGPAGAVRAGRLCPPPRVRRAAPAAGRDRGGPRGRRRDVRRRLRAAGRRRRREGDGARPRPGGDDGPAALALGRAAAGRRRLRSLPAAEEGVPGRGHDRLAAQGDARPADRPAGPGRAHEARPRQRRRARVAAPAARIRPGVAAVLRHRPRPGAAGRGIVREPLSRGLPRPAPGGRRDAPPAAAPPPGGAPPASEPPAGRPAP